MAFAAVIAVLGRLLVGFAGAMLLAALASLRFAETHEASVFAVTAALTVFVGTGLVLATRGAETRLRLREVCAIGVAAWPLLAAFGAVPFAVLGGLAPTDAFFEAVSGLTTTGATVLDGLEARARGLLFWRGLLQWLGGLATIVVAVSVMPLLGVGGLSVFHSAMPHGDHATIAARVPRTALTLGWVYGVLTGLCALALVVVGVGGFEAVVQAFSTVSSGGFSTRDGGIAAFGEAGVEGVLMAFMIASATNMTLFWALFHGRWHAFRRDPELTPFLTLALVATVAATTALVAHGSDLADALRSGAFAVVSALTTTGFAPGGDVAAPASLAVLLLALMLVGGCSGSTAGGIKVARMLLALAQSRREIARLSHPHAVVRVRYGTRTVPAPAMRAMGGFLTLFLAVFVVLAVTLALSGLSPRGAIALAVGALTNAGATLTLVAGGEADYRVLSTAAKWVLCAGMVLGRLEVVAAIAVAVPAFWRR